MQHSDRNVPATCYYLSVLHRWGYDRQGYDNNGMDKHGFDKEGFNK